MMKNNSGQNEATWRGAASSCPGNDRDRRPPLCARLATYHIGEEEQPRVSGQ